MSNSTTIPDTTTSSSVAISSTSTPIDTTTSSSVAPVTTSSVDTTTSTTPVPITSSVSSVDTTTSTPISSSIEITTTPTTTATPTTQIVVHTTTLASSSGHPASTVVVTLISTESAPSATSSGKSSSSTSTAGLAGETTNSKSSSNGLSTGGKAAIAVVIPIVVIAALVAGGIWWWRRRKANKDAEDLRRKEVEEYGYNPNNDPTLPAVGGAGATDGSYEMVEDGNSGYRGWGTTAAGSSNRKASTTVSGGAGQGIGSHAYSESTSPTLNGPDNRSGDPLMHGNGSPTYHPGDDGGEIMGAMGPSTNNNRGDVQRGPSNASSSYSAANRSDGSGEVGLPGGAAGQANYYTEYAGNGGPYNEGPGGGGYNGGGGAPVIRDVQAKRNTRIEHPSHFPQQGGISQNF